MNKKKLWRAASNKFLILIVFSMIWAESSETPAQTKQEIPGAEMQTKLSLEDEKSIKEAISLYCKLAKEGNFPDLKKTVVAESRFKEVFEAHTNAEIKTFLKNNPDLIIKKNEEKGDSTTRKIDIDNSPIFLRRRFPV